MGEDKFIFIMDIIFFYIVIFNGEGFLVFKYFFDLCIVKELSLEILFCLVELVLILNCFLFVDSYYK